MADIEITVKVTACPAGTLEIKILDLRKSLVTESWRAPMPQAARPEKAARSAFRACRPLGRRWPEGHRYGFDLTRRGGKPDLHSLLAQLSSMRSQRRMAQAVTVIERFLPKAIVPAVSRRIVMTIRPHWEIVGMGLPVSGRLARIAPAPNAEL